MSVTNEQITEYFATIGITLPSFMIDCIVDKVNEAEQCMIDAGYSVCDITMSLLIASALNGIGMGARKVASQRADVVGQSYIYDSIEDLQDLLTNNLALYDPNGCTDGVIPSKISNSFLFVTESSCHE